MQQENTAVASAAATDEPVKVLHKISDAFGIQAPDSLTLEGYDKPTRFTPKKKLNYIMPPLFFRDMLAFFKSTQIALKVNGHTGAGKSLGITQFHACLNKPIYSLTAHGGTEVGDLIGHWVLKKDGSMQWHDGPVLRAMREGESVLVNELNALRPDVLLGLNGILEGEMVYVPETEEVVVAAPGFRFFATENIDNGDGVYNGRNKQDASVEDRFWNVSMGYLDPEDEIPLVKNVLMLGAMPEDVANSFATTMVDVANRIRKRFIGVSADHDALEVTMSTRTLLMWADAIPRYKSCERINVSPVQYALMRVLTSGPIKETTRQAIHDTVQLVMAAPYHTEAQVQQLLRDERLKAQAAAAEEAKQAQQQAGA